MSDLTQAWSSLNDHMDPYTTARDYYRGDVSEVTGNAKFSRIYARTGDAYHVNFAKTPVNAVADRLEISAITVSDDRVATDVCSEIWTYNQLLHEAPLAHRAALELGDNYAIVWPDESGKAAIHFNSPLSTRLFYSPEDGRTKMFAIKRWFDGEHERANLYYADRVEKYISKGKHGSDKAEEWNLIETMENPFGQVPVFHFRTDRPYGRPEHADAYGPQDAINKLNITMMSTIDFHGLPQRYALAGGESPADLTDPNNSTVWDDDSVVDDEDISITGGESTLRSGPGELWWLKNIDSVGQFEAADVENFLKPLSMFVRSMAQVTNTPLHEFDPTGDAPSGESLRTAEAPLVKKVRDRQMSFASTWAEIFKFALLIQDIIVAAVDVRWAPAFSADSKTDWETAQLKMSSGVPAKQALMESGYTSDQVDNWVLENGRLSTEFANTAAERLAGTAQKLGAAVALGILTNDEARAILGLTASDTLE